MEHKLKTNNKEYSIHQNIKKDQKAGTLEEQLVKLRIL
jgi:hypothetical protein